LAQAGATASSLAGGRAAPGGWTTMASSGQAVRRLRRDLEQLRKESNPQLAVRPSGASMLEWHFALHSLPADTPYGQGCYHGKLVFPEDYPHAPPAMMMLTPNGRLETQRRLCLSMSDFHPESWNPAWSIESILVGLISFMIDARDPNGIGVICEPKEKRQQLARSSWAFNHKNEEFRELFPEFLGTAPPETAKTVEAEAEGEDGSRDDNEIVSTGSGTCSVAGPLVPLGNKISASREYLSPEKRSGVHDPAASATMPVASPSDDDTTVKEEEESGAMECWICREDDSREPLIQPCACRGSMSGVHASCVERWIAHHRANSLNDEAPRCSVCGQSYCGEELRPGPLGFAQHVCSDFARQALRSATLVGWLVMYWGAAQTDSIDLWVRIVLLVGSGSYFTYKLVALTVSLPRGRLRPHGPLGYFFIGDFRLVAVHIAEAVATVVIAGLWCVYGQLPYYFFLPLCLLIFLPLCSVLARYESAPCSYRAIMVVIFVMASPILIMIHLARLVWQDPTRLVDPLDGVAHIFVPLTSIPLCVFCSTNVPAVLLWSIHGAVVLCGALEKAFVRRLQWKQGRIWWVVIQLSVLAAYMANLLHSFEEGFLKDESLLLVLGVSLTWLTLVCCLCLQVNWELCVMQYRVWQHRNGSFTLNSGGQEAARPQTIGASSQTVPASGGGGGTRHTGVVPEEHVALERV